MSVSPIYLLNRFLSGSQISNREFLELKGALKPIFFTPQGFMDYARAAKRAELKAKILSESESLISGCSTYDDLVEKYSSLANELNQGAQLVLFFELLELFPSFPGDSLKSTQRDLLQILTGALHAVDTRVRDKAVMLISMYAEISNNQSRKSSSGAAAEQAVELVLKSIGLKRGEDYGSQFAYEGSNTDFTIPFAERGESYKVKAFIAVQVSTNDRARLSSSELHKGAKRFLCSLNGCTASSKTTSDIGNDLAAGYMDNETYYVVIDKERRAAVEVAKERLEKAGKGEHERNAIKRLRWLEEYAINYDQFAEMIKKMVTPLDFQ